MNESEKNIIKSKMKELKSVSVSGVKYIPLEEAIKILQEAYENSFNMK